MKQTYCNGDIILLDDATLSVYFESMPMADGTLTVTPDGKHVYQGLKEMPIFHNEKNGNYAFVSVAFLDQNHHKKQRNHRNECYRNRHIVYVHRLVAAKYHDIPSILEADDLQVHHKDANPMNNKADNLEWMTRKENNSLSTHPTTYMKTKKEGHIIKMTKDGATVYMKNTAEAGRYIGCSSQLVHYVLNPRHYAKTAKGWKLEYIPLSSMYVDVEAQKKGK